MTPDEFDTMLHDAEVKLARLRALYEQYFQGIEKLEPTVPKKDLERTFETLRRGLPRNTALRFRFQQTIARYGTYTTYWQRIGRQIEEGTFRRDLQRVRDRNLARGQQLKEGPSAWEIDVDIDAMEAGTPLDDGDLDAILGALKEKERPSAPSVPPVTTPAASPTPATGITPPAATKPAAARGLSPFVAFGKPAAPKPGMTAPPKPAASIAAVPGPAPAPQPTPTPIARPVAQPVSFAKPAQPVSFARPAATPAAHPAPTPAAAAPRPEPHAPTVSLRPEPPRPAAAKPAAPALAQKPGLDEGSMRALHERYSAARKKNNEGDVRYESLAASVEKMMPALREKHAGKKIDFEVVVANGRVGLKPKIGG